MDDHAMLYCRAAAEPGIAWLQELVDGARVERAPGGVEHDARFVVRWPDQRVTLGFPADSAYTQGLIAAMREDCAAGQGERDRALKWLDGCRALVTVHADAELADGSAPLAMLRRLQSLLDALLVRHDVLETPDGQALLTLPPEDDELDELPPPTAQRVAARSLVLAAVVARAHLEQLPGQVGDAQALLAWMDRHGLWHEAEPQEAELLRAPRGQLEAQRVIDATWRSEGLSVLCWALGLHELPPHDRQVDPQALTGAVGLFERELPAAITAPSLRSQQALDWLGRRLLGLHWRLRDFSLRPVAMDYGAFAADCWFGSFDLQGIELALGDLAIGGRPIAHAQREQVAIAQSIALERHQAINWLRGYGRLYSQVDTST